MSSSSENRGGLLKADYEAGLDLISSKIDRASIPSAPDLELLSFDLLQISEVMNLTMEEKNLRIFSNIITNERIFLFTSDYLSIPLHLVENFARSTFSVKFSNPDTDWSTKLCASCERNDPSEDLGFVYSFIANENFDCFFVVVPVESLLDQSKRLRRA